MLLIKDRRDRRIIINESIIGSVKEMNYQLLHKDGSITDDSDHKNIEITFSGGGNREYEISFDSIAPHLLSETDLSDTPCVDFEPGEPNEECGLSGSGFADAQGNGHYLCKKCVHAIPKSDPRLRRENEDLNP